MHSGPNGYVDDRQYPRYAIAAVGCVVIKDGRILLIKRGYPPRAGKWAIPGGVIEAGEDIVEAACRELREETGFEANPLGILWVYNAIVRDSVGRVQYHFVIIDILFDSESIRGTARPGGDAVDIAWFELSEVLRRDDVTGSTKRLVKRILLHGMEYLPL